MKLLKANGLAKRFGANLALDRMDLTIATGEVHGLVGANGAGKSTLVKILSGAIAADSGTIEIGDWTGANLTPRMARKLGVVTIHQDPGLAPTLGLVENITLGREHTRAHMFLRGSAQRAAAIRSLERVGLQHPTATKAGTLSPADQQLLAIARALFRDASILIMDEPTAALGKADRQRLFSVVQELRRAGVGILYISHHLDEIYDLCERVTVIRDGRLVLESRTAELPEADLIGAMIGHEVDRSPRVSRAVGEVILSLRGLQQGERIRDISFDLHAGEVLGITGLVGSGRTRLAKLLFGVERPTGGDMQLFGRPYQPREPADAIASGVGLVPQDRVRDALLMQLSTPKNITIAQLPSRLRVGLRLREERRLAREWINRFDIKPSSLKTVPRHMSGGNQQKVVLARWLFTGARLVILDEPTQGVDIHAREQIVSTVRDLAERGVAVIYITEELDELFEVANRALVMRKGRIVGDLPHEEITESHVIPLAMGGAASITTMEVSV